jgi:hypothetical protein
MQGSVVLGHLGKPMHTRFFSACEEFDPGRLEFFRLINVVHFSYVYNKDWFYVSCRMQGRFRFLFWKEIIVRGRELWQQFILIRL